MIFSRSNEELDDCLACGKKVSSFTWQTNNGVCDGCPPLVEIAPQFWRVISHLAAQGDLNAQEVLRKYASSID